MHCTSAGGKQKRLLPHVVHLKSVLNGGPVLDGSVDVTGYHAIGGHRVTYTDSSIVSTFFYRQTLKIVIDQ